MIKQVKGDPLVSNHCGGKWYPEGMRAGIGKRGKTVIIEPEDAFINQR